MIDYHIHSSISTDAQDEMPILVAAAEKKGLKEICFTEHVDFDYPYETQHQWISDMDLYDQKYRALPKSSVIVKKGLEIGLTYGMYDRADAMIDGNHLDFIIASQHYVGGDDPYLRSFYLGKEQRQVYEEYLMEMNEHLKAYDNYDVVGHIGYITRYAPYQDCRLRYRDYPELLDAVLNTVIDKGKGIEMNTGGFQKFGDSLPGRDILARYRELGGTIITIGSDAHDAKRVGDHVAESVNILKALGFSYLTVYTQRKPEFIKL